MQAGRLLEWRALHFFNSNEWPFIFWIDSSASNFGCARHFLFYNKCGRMPLLEEG